MRKLLALIAFSGLLVFTGCSKDENKSYDLRVKVVNEDGIPVQNALVRFYVPSTPSGEINRYQYTGPNGEVVFRYKWKIFANVDAGKGPFQGCSFAELQEGQEVFLPITLKPYSDPTNGCVN